jgi:hypothetical protein
VNWMQQPIAPEFWLSLREQELLHPNAPVPIASVLNH